MTPTRISKLLALALRHRPEALGLTLDAEGWADVHAVLAGLRTRGITLDTAGLQRLVAADAKRRYRLSEDGARIRASQGHSLPVDLALAPTPPPDTLFHGTTPEALPAILREGLRPMRRQFVHLSPDVDTARQVGLRRTRTPVILAIDAGRLWAEGRPFFVSENGVWLVERVEPGRLRPLPP